MEKPDWAQIVQVLYKESPSLPPLNIEEGHPFIDGTDLSAEQAQDAVEAVGEWGFVSSNPRERAYSPETGQVEVKSYGYALTKEGFEVAHERELSSRNNNINQSLVFLTFVLVIAQLIGAIPLGDLAKVVIGLMILFLMTGVIWKTDLLSEY